MHDDVEGLLEQKRVAQQREQRAEIGQGVQAIGRAAPEGAGPPRLHQRAGGREDEVRQPESGGQQRGRVQDGHEPAIGDAGHRDDRLLARV